VYVADRDNDRIQKFDAVGNFESACHFGARADTQIHDPRGIAIDPRGRAYVTDFSAHRVYVLDGAAVIGSWGSEGAGHSQFVNPTGIACGQQGLVYVCDCRNNRVQTFRVE
jgi:DNA-binding beta-propeller fold protein YncE